MLGDLWGNYSEEDLYQIAVGRPLEEKELASLMLLKTFEAAALELSPTGYYGCFSGGKDSIVIAHLMKKAGVKHELWYNNVTIDPPVLVRFILDHYPHAKWNNVGTHLLRYMVERGKLPPTRMVRWCCDVYKEQGGNKQFKVMGVRGPESPRRKGLWREVTVHQRSRSKALCPILYWTDDDVWTYIRRNNLEYPSLYDEVDGAGKKLFPRLGCIGCPMSSRRKLEFERFPQYEAMWRKAINELWAKWKDIPRKDGERRKLGMFASGDELWQWWMEEENVNDTDEPDCQMWLW